MCLCGDMTNIVFPHVCQQGMISGQRPSTTNWTCVGTMCVTNNILFQCVSARRDPFILRTTAKSGAAAATGNCRAFLQFPALGIQLGGKHLETPRHYQLNFVFLLYVFACVSVWRHDQYCISTRVLPISFILRATAK